MINSTLDYLKYNVLDTSEVSEVLQLPKSEILAMVEKGVFRPFKDFSEGMLFLKSDIDQIIGNMGLNLPIHRVSKRNIMHDESGTTDRSLQYFEENIVHMDEIESIFIFFERFDAANAGFYKVDKEDEEDRSGDLFPISTPNFVIRDINGKEMWLEGCNCGYGGEGPRGSKTILEKLGFSEDIVNLIPYYNLINIFIDGNQIEVIKHNGLLSKSKIKSHMEYNEINARLFYSKLANNLILVQTKSIGMKITPMEILQKYRCFISNPSKALIFPTSELAKAYGYTIHNASRLSQLYSTYNVIITDSTGREFWLAIPFQEDVPISEQSEICEVLQYCGFGIPENKVSDKIIKLFNSTIKKSDPEPIIIEK